MIVRRCHHRHHELAALPRPALRLDRHPGRRLRQPLEVAYHLVMLGDALTEGVAGDVAEGWDLGGGGGRDEHRERGEKTERIYRRTAVPPYRQPSVLPSFRPSVHRALGPITTAFRNNLFAPRQ